MKTRRLFKEDVYMKDAEAVVTAVTAGQGGRLLVTLDRTIFFPTGGGQSCDLGTIAGREVLEVYQHEDEIYHVLAGEGEPLAPGQTVALALDWERRFDNMQRHCGEHILSGIFHREFGGVNRGFHMGDNYMTIDISLEENPAFTEITWEMALRAELLANEAIWQNLPVTSRHFDRREEAEKLPLRKKLALNEDITIVCVGSPDNPSDCVACCGTHPDSAGQVGMIKIYKVESNKGMFRIYFEAGKRALLDYDQRFDTLTQLSEALSAGHEDVLAKYASQQEKNRLARTQLHLLKKEIIRREASSLIAEMNGSGAADAAGSGVASDAGAAGGRTASGAGAAGAVSGGAGFAAAGAGDKTGAAGGRLVVREYELLSADDISALAREIGDAIPRLLFLVQRPSMTVFLCTGAGSGLDCGKLVKENAPIYGGKGGGSKTFARAIFSKAEYIPVFIDLIEKHLR